MYKCPICKQSRTSKLHSDKCSKIARDTLEQTKTAEKIDYSAIPTPDTCRWRKTLNRF